MRRLIAVGGTVALLATTGISLAGPAAAADDGFSFDFHRPEINLKPGEGWAEIGIGSFSGDSPDGTYVFALSGRPLDDPTWAGGGLPAGLTAETDEECKASATVKGVYLCRADSDQPFAAPRVFAAKTTAHDTKLHYGLVYVARGADLDAGVKDAQLAATKPVDGTHAVRTVTVKSAEHVAQNTMKFDVPDLPATGSVTQSVALHAVDKGLLKVTFASSAGQRRWRAEEVTAQITSAAGGPGTACNHTIGSLAEGGIDCEVEKPGDYTVTYALQGGKDLAAWKVDVNATYEVYNFGTGNPEAAGHFGVRSSLPVRERHSLLARKPDGSVTVYRGSGRAPQVFRAPDWTIGGWEGYTALAKLGPLAEAGTGNGVVARDAAGVLWSYGVHDTMDVVNDPMKVGGGWNAYNALAGIGDGTGDGKNDLVARNAAGTLYFYEGTGKQSAPFKPKAEIGGGWQAYDSLTGLGDATGDGKGDLVARDKAGVLWFYEGTGRAAAPFKPKVQIGGGWQGFSALSGTGDLNDDGRSDLVARDRAGVLWFYEGAGKPAAPFKAKVRVGAGWNAFNSLV
ncbi:FG-GAP repeat domain-containing protein [Streptomyces sp. NPDC054863]